MKGLVAVMSLILIPAISIWGLIEGWGLTVRSWPVVIASYVLVMFISIVGGALEDR